MQNKQPERANIATPLEGAKLHAPSAARNLGPLCDLLRQHAPQEGAALEIASGTGQHVTAFAQALPRLSWQPTDVAPERLNSINAWAAESGASNILAARNFDASMADVWRTYEGRQNLVVLINLLHLISTEDAKTVISGAVAALAPGGCFVLYGPFRRNGQFISSGDADFHAHITAADPTLGYKDDTDIESWLRSAGAQKVARQQMPANNLAFIATR